MAGDRGEITTATRMNGSLNGHHITPCSKKPVPEAHQYAVGQDVLARWTDGLFYLGTILRMDDEGKRCYVKFEDDSEYWIFFRHLQRGPDQGEIHCVLCQGEVSDEPNQIVLCDHCGLGYHQRCHNPVIEEDVLKPDVEWLCRQCVFAATSKRGGAVKRGPNAQGVEVTKQPLPYDPKKLTWDNSHRTNAEMCHCYCGGPGDWYMRMLQCWRCKQWFHEACVHCLEHPILLGDQFYLFVCSMCNAGPEYIKRLELSWPDLVQLALFNLTILSKKKYFDLTESLQPWLNEHWDDLQLSQFSDVLEEERWLHVAKALEKNRKRFQSGREIKKRQTLWGLRVRVPPPPPKVILPVDGPITEEVMSNLQVHGRKTKTFIPMQSSSPIPFRSLKRKASCDPCDIFRKIKRAKQLLEDATTVETMNGYLTNSQHYYGYSYDPASYTMQYPQKLQTNTLNRLIPQPNDFRNYNHPFKSQYERNQELEQARLKERLLENLSAAPNSCEGSDLVTDIASETPSSSMISSMSGEEHRPPVVPVKRPRGRPKKYRPVTTLEASQIPKDGQLTPGSTPKDIVSLLSKVNGLVKSDLPTNHQVIASTKAASKDEADIKFEVEARRQMSDGKLQYLINWSGMP